MTGKGQHIRQEVSEKTAEEYRATADEHAQTLKDFWKRFMVSGLFVMAAIVIILACLAWFLNNTQVNAGGVNISAAGAKLALVETEQGSNVGAYEQDKTATNFDTSNSMTVTLNSNLNNYTSGSLYPGARGQIKFTVQPLTKDLNGATIDISRVLQLKDGDRTLVKESDCTQQNMPDTLKLAKGHLLFFTACSDASFYSNHVTDSIVIDKSKFQDESGNTTKPVACDAVVGHGPSTSRTLCTPATPTTTKTSSPQQARTTPACKRTLMGIGTISITVMATVRTIPELSNEMKSAALGQCADYYNKADDYLGNNVEYLQLQLSADETPRGTGQ